MLCACTSYATCANLAAIRDVLTQGVDVLVINEVTLFWQKLHGFFLNFLLRAAAFAPLFLGSFKARLFLAPIVVLLFEGPSFLKEFRAL